MKLSIIITVLALKLYLEYRRNENKIAQQIGINKRNTSFQYRYKRNIIEIFREGKPFWGIWSNNITEMINKRNIRLINTEKMSYIETRNDTIIDYAVKYLKEK